MYISSCGLSFFPRDFFQTFQPKNETVPEIQGSYYGTKRDVIGLKFKKVFYTEEFPI